MNQKQRHVRLFISSTFSDMMAEREHLMKIIFPQLRRRCKARFVELTEVDLRWGIPEELSREGKVIEICLSEIDKSRPYFIGILGNRYGWVPGKEELEKQTALTESFPWTKDDIAEGRSITEMEIQYGVLRNPAMDGRAFFYFKGTEENLEEDISAKDKLRLLKQKIAEDKRFPHTYYKSIGELGEMILNDLWNQIDAGFPALEVPDEHEREKIDLAAFAASHKYFSLDAEGNIPAILESIQKNPVTAVYAQSGLGKSALVSAVEKNVANDISVLSYFCGTTPESSALEGLVRYTATELKRRFEIPYNISQKLEDPAALLLAFIQAIPAGNKTLIAFDGLDKLSEEDGFRLLWLPASLPEHVKLLLTTASDEQGKILLKSDIPVFELSPLSSMEKVRLSVRYLNEYSKQLPVDLLNLISGFEIAGNPLVLFTLLNELRIFGRHEDLPQFLNSYVKSKDSDDFFSRFLNRLEQDFPEQEFSVRALLSSLVLAQKGLTETEITQIHQLPPLKWSQVYNALDYHILNKGGKLSLGNPYLVAAVEKRYLSEKDVRNQQLKPLFGHFAGRFSAVKKSNDTSDLHRILEELPELALKADEAPLLLEAVTYMPALKLLFSVHNQKLPYYFAVLGNTYDMPAELHKSLQSYLEKESFSDPAYEAAFLCGHLISAHVSAVQAFPFYYEVLSMFVQSPRRNQYVFETLKELSAAYRQLGSIDEGAEILLNLLPFRNGDDVTEIFDLLPEYFRNKGQSEIAEMLLNDSLNYAVHHSGSSSLRAAVQHNNLARHFDILNNYEKAQKHYAEAARITEALYGSNHSMVQVIASNQGIQMLAHGRFAEAKDVFEKVLQGRIAMYGISHRLTLKTMNSLGVACLKLGEAAEAEKWLTRAWEGQNQLLGPDHKETIITFSNIADLKAIQGDHVAAAANLSVLLERSIAQYGEVHEQTINNAIGLARALKDSGKTEESIQTYSFLIRIQKQFYGDEHMQTAYSLYQRALLRFETGQAEAADVDAVVNWKMMGAEHQREKGNIQAAADNYAEALEIIDKLTQGNHPAVVQVLDNLSGAFNHLKEYSKAAGYSKRIAEMAGELYGQEHPFRLEHQMIYAFNLFLDGQRQEALQQMYGLQEFHEKLMQFPRKHVAGMYRELLSYYNGLNQAIQLQETSKDEMQQLFQQIDQLMAGVENYFRGGHFPEAVATLDQIISNAAVLNQKFAIPYIEAFNHKAMILEKMEEYQAVIDTADAGLEFLGLWNHEFDRRGLYLCKKAANVLMMAEKYDLSITYLNRAMRMNQLENDYPNAETVELNMTLIHYLIEMEKFEEAIELTRNMYPLAIEKLGEEHELTLWYKEIIDRSNN